MRARQCSQDSAHINTLLCSLARSLSLSNSVSLPSAPSDFCCARELTRTLDGMCPLPLAGGSVWSWS